MNAMLQTNLTTRKKPPDRVPVLNQISKEKAQNFTQNLPTAAASAPAALAGAGHDDYLSQYKNEQKRRLNTKLNGAFSSPMPAIQPDEELIRRFGPDVAQIGQSEKGFVSPWDPQFFTPRLQDKEKLQRDLSKIFFSDAKKPDNKLVQPTRRYEH